MVRGVTRRSPKPVPAQAGNGTGNRTGEVTGATTDTLSYPAASNRISNVLTGVTTTRTFVHDAAGNITTDTRSGSAFTYTYNAQLVTLLQLVSRKIYYHTGVMTSHSALYALPGAAMSFISRYMWYGSVGDDWKSKRS